MSNPDVLPHPTVTDEVEKPVKVTKKTGKGSKSRRAAEYREKKNQETDAAIQAGIWARLKIRDPTNIAPAPMVKETHSVIVPICFNKVPTFVDRVWDSMQAFGSRPFANMDTAENKAIYKKGILRLCEAKVCVAQRVCPSKPDEHLDSRKLYTEEELHDIGSMCTELPYPIAALLECIGLTSDQRQMVVPTLAKMQGDLELCSGAITYAPSQLMSLFDTLRDGVPLNGQVHQLADALTGLPSIEWEQEDAADAGDLAIARLTDQSIEFWAQDVDGELKFNWTDDDQRLFERINRSMKLKKGFIVDFDLSHGQGTLAQTVQTSVWTIDSATSWFSMTEIPDYDIKFGVALGLSPDASVAVQPSRFRGRRETSVLRGEITPRRLFDAILAAAIE